MCGGLDFWGASVCGGLLAILDFGGLVCLSPKTLLFYLGKIYMSDSLGTSINDVRCFLTFVLPTYLVRRFLPNDVQFWGSVWTPPSYP